MAICDITILAITIASLLVKMRTKTLPRPILLGSSDLLQKQLLKQ